MDSNTLGIIKDAQNGPVYINQKGEILPFSVNNPDDPTLRELQKAVGGVMQMIRLSKYKLPELCFICNQEGKMHRLNSNVKATAVWNMYFGQDEMGNDTQDIIVGDVIIAPSSWLFN